MRVLFKKIFYSLFRLGVVIAVLTTAIWYVHTNVMGYERVICEPDNLPRWHVCLSSALADWKDKILLVDARSQDAFERSAVVENAGEWSLYGMPVIPLRNDSEAQNLLAQAMPHLLKAASEGRRIIVFCDKSCSSSDEIAGQLRDSGLDVGAPIYVLEGGWDALRKEFRSTKK